MPQPISVSQGKVEKANEADSQPREHLRPIGAPNLNITFLSQDIQTTSVNAEGRRILYHGFDVSPPADAVESALTSVGAILLFFG
jgi:hypothetical protein